MPNAMNRFKPNQLIKVEKENENKDIKRKLKSIHREKGAASKAETVWERLSKVRKSVSSDNSLDGAPRSRTNLNPRSAHRLPVARAGSQRTAKKLISPNSLSSNRRFAVERKMQLSRGKDMTAVLLDEKDNGEKIDFFCLPTKMVQEILTARSMCNSKSSSKWSSRKSTPRSNMSLNSLCKDDGHDFMLCCDDDQHRSTDTNEDYEVAPLIPVPTKDSLNSSVKIMENFCSMLEVKQRSMPREEIELVKNVVKTDVRHHNLSRDDSKLFKDILKTQLKEILKQETAVKSALTNLDVSTDDISTEVANTDITTSLSLVQGEVAAVPALSQKKPQVDVIFKNVPTLEKEIIILKALGEKLEATLQRTMSQRVLNVHLLNNIASNSSLNHMHVRYERQEQPKEQQVQYWLLTSKGILSEMGFVREFRMAQKSIVELKENVHRHFYLPVTRDNSELQRTNFKHLKENPDVLMRHIKPKNSLVPFNVLEQDPIFFNSFLSTIVPLVANAASLSETQSSPEVSDDACSNAISERLQTDDKLACRQRKEPLSIEEIRMLPSPSPSPSPSPKNVFARRSESKNQNSCILAVAEEPEEPEERMEKEEREATEKEEKRRKEAAAKEEAAFEQEQALLMKRRSYITELQQQEISPFEAPIRGKQRRRIRGAVTPMRVDKYVHLEPKSNVFKTVLVGAAQISLFLLLIMAITYPDVRC